jgi:hypothetical protein
MNSILDSLAASRGDIYIVTENRAISDKHGTIVSEHLRRMNISAPYAGYYKTASAFLTATSPDAVLVFIYSNFTANECDVADVFNGSTVIDVHISDITSKAPAVGFLDKTDHHVLQLLEKRVLSEDGIARKRALARTFANDSAEEMFFKRMTHIDLDPNGGITGPEAADISSLNLSLPIVVTGEPTGDGYQVGKTSMAMDIAKQDKRLTQIIDQDWRQTLLLNADRVEELTHLEVKTEADSPNAVYDATLEMTFAGDLNSIGTVLFCFRRQTVRHDRWRYLVHAYSSLVRLYGDVIPVGLRMKG